MRIGSLVALALAIPSAAFAQVGGLGGGIVPGSAVPLSPQPEIVARATGMSRSRTNRALGVPRSRYTFETYPVLSHVVAPSYANGRAISSWNSVGAGTQVEYRFSSYASVTGDVSSSMYGGPGNTQTAELGIRFHPEDREAALRPFVDVRAGYGRTADQYSDLGGIGLGAASTVTMAQRYSHGFGAAIGGGAEYSLTNALALSTNVSAMRSNMSMYDYTGYSVPTTGSYTMTTYRLALGLRYSPVFRRSDDRH